MNPKRVGKLGPQLFEDDLYDDVGDGRYEDGRRLAIAIQGGRVPDCSPGGSLTPRWDAWRRLPAWTRDEALALIFAPVLLRITSEPLAVLLRRHIDEGAHLAVDRAIEIGQIADPAPPREWLALARRLDWTIPPELENRPAKANEPGPPLRELLQFLKQEGIRDLTPRERQREAARQHFHPKAIPARLFQKAFQALPRHSGRRRK